MAADVNMRSLKLFIRFVNYYSLTARSKIKVAQILFLLATDQLPQLQLSANRKPMFFRKFVCQQCRFVCREANK